VFTVGLMFMAPGRAVLQCNVFSEGTAKARKYAKARKEQEFKQPRSARFSPTCRISRFRVLSRFRSSHRCSLSHDDCAAANKTAAGLAAGSVAPEFVLPDIQGRPVRLGDHRGQVVVLNFWAFWCDTWKAEMPHLRELIGWQKELGFRLIAISVDGTRLPEFRARTGGGHVPFPVLTDVGGAVCARYKIAHVPTVVIVDQTGRVQYTASGYPGNHVILRELRKLASATNGEGEPAAPVLLRAAIDTGRR
jgi:peroxiredoxin